MAASFAKTHGAGYKESKKKLHAGSYAISVRFLKEKDGSIADCKALNDPGYGLAPAAVEVVKGGFSGPKWNPNEASRNNVRSYHTQLISFRIGK